ncbi:putative ATP-dependent RNA helicase DHX35 [Morella rubra]|uniref:RNA helicase n=1 Tax=Morella rubra TaxID=262757 RepID=A0A6A1UKX2_9ROSI|nr:putative ATP-dependent RNA helicase DHX35 [Morella rubra]
MGDVLAFLTGQDDIDAAIQLLNEQAHRNRKNSSAKVGESHIGAFVVFNLLYRIGRIICLSRNAVSVIKFYETYSHLLGKIDIKHNNENRGKRKVVISTNIAETSLTLELKALGIDNILGFDWPASPSPEAMIQALEVLYSLGVLDDDAKLTSPAGFQVAEIPLEPMISKMILSSSKLGCSEEIITVAAVLSVQHVFLQSIWVSGRGVQRELDEAKLRFAAAEGDRVTFLNVYKVFLQSGKSSPWCHKDHVNYHAMTKVVEIREQLRRIAQRLGIILKSCEGDMQNW